MSTPAVAFDAGRPVAEPVVRPVRVMHVMHQLCFGGMELGVVKLVNALDRSRIASSICSCRPANAAREKLAPDIPLIELERRAGNDPALVARLYRLFRRERPHVVHTHAWGTLVEGLVAARLARVPVVIHGEHGTLQTKPHQRLAQRLMWGRADVLLSVSSKLAERMSREIGFPLSRIRTIRNGVDLGRFDPALRAEGRAMLDLPADALAVGTVGRLVPVKDQRTLVAAAARLRQAHPTLQLLIAGDGPLRPELEAQAEALGLGGAFRLLGNRPDIERVLPAFDVFVLSSVSEGLSNTIQEAMASGLPVVATDVGGASELVIPGETGELIPAGDPIAMADAIGPLLSSAELRQRMGAAARRRTETEFSLKGMVENYERVYVSCVAASRASRNGSRR